MFPGSASGRRGRRGRVVIRDDAAVQSRVTGDRFQRAGSEVGRKRHVHIGIVLVELRRNWIRRIPVSERHEARAGVIDQRVRRRNAGAK